MSITDILGTYLVPVIVGICLIVGYLLKNALPVANNYIPTIVTVLGVLLAIWSNRAVTPEVILMGMASGLASTGLHQLLKTWLEKLSSGSDNNSNSGAVG